MRSAHRTLHMGHGTCKTPRAKATVGGWVAMSWGLLGDHLSCLCPCLHLQSRVSNRAHLYQRGRKSLSMKNQEQHLSH